MAIMFKPIGKFFGGLYDDVKREMNLKNNKDTEDNENE
jgi:hypothetical protein